MRNWRQIDIGHASGAESKRNLGTETTDRNRVGLVGCKRIGGNIDLKQTVVRHRRIRRRISAIGTDDLEITKTAGNGRRVRTGRRGARAPPHP